MENVKSEIIHLEHHRFKQMGNTLASNTKNKISVNKIRRTFFQKKNIFEIRICGSRDPKTEIPTLLHTSGEASNLLSTSIFKLSFLHI